MTADEIRRELRCGRPGCSCAREAGNVHCPAHEDEDPSFSVTERDGRVLVHDHAGCSQEAVLAALRAKGLWPESSTGLTVEELAAAKRLHTDFLRSLGVRTIYERGLPRVRIAYMDERGEVAAVRFRKALDGAERFAWRRGDKVLLYGLWRLQRVREAGWLLLVEGESDCWTAWHYGLPALGIPGKSTWRSGWREHLRADAVYLWCEPDAADLVERVARDVPELRVIMPPDGMKDLSEAHVRGENVTALIAQLKAEAKPAGEVLAALRETQRQREIAAVVQRVGGPPEITSLLDDTTGFIARYVVIGPEQATALALWVALTWVLDAVEVAPYLHIGSPEKRSAKTRLLEVLTCLVARPWFTSRVSPAVLVRKVAAQMPTLLLDEMDAALKSGDEYAEALRGVLNSGYRRGGQVSLCVKQGAEIALVDFPTFGPKALAGIGSLPDTVGDRCIPIRLRRRKPNEPVERFRLRDAQALAGPMRERFAAWAVLVAPALKDARPEIPPAMHDRAAEVWEPLLAIADVAGGDWPQRARQAAVMLHGDPLAVEETIGVTLLAAIRDAFDVKRLDRLATADLLAALVERDDGPWAEWWGRAVAAGDTQSPAHRLSRLLRPFGIEPKTIRLPEDGTAKGYYREAFEDAWSRYLPVENVTSSQPAPDAAKMRDDDLRTRNETSRVSAARDAACDDVTMLKVKDGSHTDFDALIARALELFGGEAIYDGEPWEWPPQRRAALLEAAAKCGWPKVECLPGVMIAAGETAWRMFIRTAADRQVDQALAALEELH